jgi:hypothetical protein
MRPAIDRYSQYWAGPESTGLKPVLGSFWNVLSGFFLVQQIRCFLFFFISDGLSFFFVLKRFLFLFFDLSF